MSTENFPTTSAGITFNRAATVTALALSLGLSLPAASTTDSKRSAETDAEKSDVERMEFDVFLGDRPIGNHEFVLSNDDDETTVAINADFKVKVLFVTAYRYEHENVEVWAGDCLQSIDATTVVNGEEYTVDGDQSEKQCARSFAYWDRSLLDSAELLNSQTGDFVPTTLTAVGEGELTIGDEKVAVDRYRLTGDDLEITLSYTEDDAGNEEWVGLSTEVEGGRTLNYVRTPDTLSLAAAD